MSRTANEVQAPQAVEKAANYLLPKPRGKAADLVVEVRSPSFLRHREAAVARSLGERAMAVAECQQHLFAELRDCLGELDRSIGEATRVRLQTQVRTAESVLEWCEAVLADQLADARLAASGRQPVEVVAVCEDVAGRWRADGAEVTVTGSEGTWWGDAAALEDMVDAGLRLVSERARGAASLSVGVAIHGGRAEIAIESAGEPQDDIDAQVLTGFRDAVAHIGGTVRPGRFGRGGAGLCVDLPAPEAASPGSAGD